jgi:ribosomal protein S18 acetylase RimI-like enzyme
MYIRRAKLADIERLAILNKHLIEDEGHPNPMNVSQLARRMSGWLKNVYTAYLVVQEGETVAYCLFRDDGGCYYLRHLFVDRGFRRRGMATQLLDWMYKNVWTDKFVRLEVLAHNEGAIEFYRNYGFEVRTLNMEK